MTAKIIKLSTDYHGDLPSEKVIGGAMEAGLQSAVVVGIDKDGKFYFASTYGDYAETSFLLQRAIWKLSEWADLEEPE